MMSVINSQMVQKRKKAETTENKNKDREADGDMRTTATRLGACGCSLHYSRYFSIDLKFFKTKIYGKKTKKEK